MIFDLRKFWLATAVYGLIIGGTIAAVGAAFHAFIGMPTKAFQPVVTPAAPIQASGGKAAPVAIERKIAAPGELPPSAPVRPAPAANIAVTSTPPEFNLPLPQIIVPEPRSTRRGRSGF